MATSSGGGDRDEVVARVAASIARVETATLPSAVRSLLDTDLTLQQVKVLTVLVAAPDGETVQGLATTAGVSTASMSTMVDRLVAQGVVSRGSAPHDLRVRVVRATDTGRQAVRTLVGARPEFAGDVLSRLPLADLRALDRGLRAVAAALDEPSA